MNINNNKHKLRATILTTCIIALLSCSKESIIGEHGASGEPATIAVNTRAANDAGDLDEKVASLRVMTFTGSGDGDRIEFNTLRTAIATDMTTFDLRTGTRTVVFISNETTTLATTLANVATLGDLKNITVEWSAFSATAAIPAYTRYDAVTISKNEGSAAIISGSGTDFTGGKWTIALERLAVKIKALTLTSESNKTAAFSGITFSNLPSNVPLVPSVKYNTSGAAQEGTMIPASDFDVTYTSGVWKAVQKGTTRIILPSKEFTPSTAESHAITMTANMSSGASPSGSVHHTSNPLDYTLHRNTKYTLSATMTFNIKVNVAAQEWTSQDIPSTIGRELNISAYNVTLGSDNKYIIYFSSNQPTVTVDPTAIKKYQGTQSTEATTVSMEPFTEEAGNYSYNYISETGRGDGWIKIVSNEAFERHSERKISINAGGLKRQITVTRN